MKNPVDILDELDRQSDFATKDWKKEVFSFLERVSEEAFELGIKIPEIVVSDHYGEIFGRIGGPYGDRFLIKAPKGKFESDFGTIKIKRIKLNEI